MTEGEGAGACPETRRASKGRTRLIPMCGVSATNRLLSDGPG